MFLGPYVASYLGSHFLEAWGHTTFLKGQNPTPEPSSVKVTLLAAPYSTKALPEVHKDSF